MIEYTINSSPTLLIALTHIYTHIQRPSMSFFLFITYFPSNCNTQTDIRDKKLHLELGTKEIRTKIVKEEVGMKGKKINGNILEPQVAFVFPGS